MKEVVRFVKNFLRGADLPLLFICLLTAAFGCVLISSAARTLPEGSMHYVRTQIIAIIIGVVLFFVFTLIPVDFLARLWKWILPFNILMILALIPFGKLVDGNKSWIDPKYLPISMTIQPAEIVKVSFIVLLAAQMYYFRDKVNHVIPMGTFALHTIGMVALIVIISGDLGVAIIYIAVFICMLTAAGVKLRWFAIAGATLAACAPFLWSNILSDNQRSRITIALNPYMDPTDTGWHAIQSMNTVGGGGLFGQGLYKGLHTQLDTLYARHTDFIFSVCAEELGFIGCLGIILLLTVIIARCLYVAARARNGLGALICAGVAGMTIFQTFLNIGMCVGLFPIVGITLPFFSAGGSSTITYFAAMGLVSSVKFRPKVTWLDY